MTDDPEAARSTLAFSRDLFGRDEDENRALISMDVVDKRQYRSYPMAAARRDIPGRVFALPG